MRIQGLAITAVLVAVLLAGCTNSNPYPFLAVEPSADDILEVGGVDETEIDPDTVRYQGSADGTLVYLALSPDDGPLQTVHLILVSDDDSGDWMASSSRGDGNMTAAFGSFEAIYLPNGSDTAPDGWVPLSEWVAVRE